MVAQYYYWLSTLAREFTLPISSLAGRVNIPLVSVLLFGLIGAFAPCQLSTGVAALSFIARRAGEPRAMWARTLAYLAGKATVYLLVGGVVVLLGLQLNQISRTAIPVIVAARTIPSQPPPPRKVNPYARSRPSPHLGGALCFRCVNDHRH